MVRQGYHGITLRNDVINIIDEIKKKDNYPSRARVITIAIMLLKKEVNKSGVRNN